MQKERDGSMSASFNPKDWFVEEPRKENKTVSQASNSQKQQRQQKQNTVSSYFCPWCNKTYVVPSETITCPVCHKTFFEAFATQSGEKKSRLAKNWSRSGLGLLGRKRLHRKWLRVSPRS